MKHFLDFLFVTGRANRYQLNVIGSSKDGLQSMCMFSFSVRILNYSCKDSFFTLCLFICWWFLGYLGIFLNLYSVCDLNMTGLCHNFQCECGFADSVRNSWHHFGYGDQCPISSAAADSWNWETNKGTVSSHYYYNTDSQQAWRWDYHIHYIRIRDADIQVLEHYFLVVGEVIRQLMCLYDAVLL